MGKKLFRITDKRTEGICDAMRCSEKEITTGWNYPDRSTTVQLCKRHSEELMKYYKDKEQQDDKQLSLPVTDKQPLEKILTSNLAVSAGAVESREENAKKVHAIAKQFIISDKLTREKAEKLLLIAHNEEKAIKKEMDEMYKPIKDAASSTRNKLKSWFGPTLEFLTEAKAVLKDKVCLFVRAEQEAQIKELAAGEHDKAAERSTEASENVSFITKKEYAIENDGKNLPLTIKYEGEEVPLLVPDELKVLEIIKILPREMLRPNHGLIETLVQKYGITLQIPDVMVITYDDVKVKGQRSK